MGSPAPSGPQHEDAAVHHALPNQLQSAFASDRGPRAAPLRLRWVTAHARKCARGLLSSLRAACGSLPSGSRTGHSTGRLPRLGGLGLGGGEKGVSDRIRRLGSACPCLQVVSPGSLGREASGGRLAMADPFSSKARVVAAAALSSSTGGPAVLIGLHLPEIF